MTLMSVDIKLLLRCLNDAFRGFPSFFLAFIIQSTAEIPSSQACLYSDGHTRHLLPRWRPTAPNSHQPTAYGVSTRLTLPCHHPFCKHPPPCISSADSIRFTIFGRWNPPCSQNPHPPRSKTACTFSLSRYFTLFVANRIEMRWTDLAMGSNVSNEIARHLPYTWHNYLPSTTSVVSSLLSGSTPQCLGFHVANQRGTNEQ